MAKVRVKNVGKGNVGLSFTWLPVGAESIVEEDVISEADQRLVNKGLVAVLPIDAEPEAEVKKTEETEETPAEKTVDETAADEKTEETPEEPEKTEETPEAPEAPEAEKTEEAPADEPKGESEGEAEEAKVYSEEDLQGLSKANLKKIAEPLGITAKSKKDLVASILEAQSKEG